ncbi:MAG: TM0106 family RecB-like putative nuclease [Gordonia sp. (in: high G+C Gram-positive bacteria)]
MRSAVLGARNLAGCEHRLALDFSRADEAAAGESAEAGRRMEAAQEHRARVIEMLLGMQSSRPGTCVVVDDQRPHRERVAQTLAACEAGAAWIFHAALPVDVEHGRRGHSEILVRSGDGYVPVIIVNHRVTTPAKAARDPEVPPALLTSPLWGWLPAPDGRRTSRSNRRDALRLTHLTAMLRELGLSAAADPDELLAGVIGSDADCIVALRIGPLLEEYDDTLARRRAIADGRIETVPSKVSECRSCLWWPSCEADLTDRRDVSLVVGGSGLGVLQLHGIDTVDQLAEFRGDPPEDWPNNTKFDDAVVIANCWLRDVPLVRRLDRPRVRRADVEVDVDMESFGERGAYMWGTLLTDNTDSSVPVIYRSFVTWDPLPTLDEGRSFGQFWTWLMDERGKAHAQGKTFAAYCYSQQAENRWLRGSADRFSDQAAVPTRAEVDAFIDSDEWVDVYEAVTKNFICPKGKGLKVIAPIAGFGWRDDEAGGEASMDWYAAAVGLDGGPLDVSQRARLLEYNEDDVQATKVLREWLSSEEILELPRARDLVPATAS